MNTLLRNLTNVLFLLAGWTGVVSCEDYFDAKPDQSIVVPQSLDDFQAILDAEPRSMNTSASVGLLGSDDVFLDAPVLNRMDYAQVSSYYWREEFYLPDEHDANWYTSYRKVFHANLILDGLKEFKPKGPNEEQQMKVIEASARFYRALGHFEALALFSPVFDPDDEDLLGVPIRLSSDPNLKVGRWPQTQAYAQIIEDLNLAMEYLPGEPDILTRPSRWAAHALFSRMYLYRGDYEKALEHANRVLEIGNTLVDYSKLDSSSTYPLKLFNPEVIHHGQLLSGRYASNGSTYVNPDLEGGYGKDDLRPFFFFRKSSKPPFKNFRGNYTGSFYFFGGLALDEVVLNRAEAAARLGRDSEALESLNHLLKNRINPKAFSPVSGLSGEELLGLVLDERRKELVFRGIRWLDLKRLNLDSRWAISLSRPWNQEKPILSPNDPRYVIPIPPMEMSLNPMEQNPR